MLLSCVVFMFICICFYIRSKALQSLCCIFDFMPNQNKFVLSYLISVLFPIHLCSFLVCGEHTVEQYSRFDLTIALYAFSFGVSFLTFRFLRRNPSYLLAFPVMLQMWVFHVRSLESVSYVWLNVCMLHITHSTIFFFFQVKDEIQ